MAWFISATVRRSRYHRHRSRSRPDQETDFSSRRLCTRSAGLGAGPAGAAISGGGRRPGRRCLGVGGFRGIVVSSVAWPGLPGCRSGVPAMTRVRPGTLTTGPNTYSSGIGGRWFQPGGSGGAVAAAAGAAAAVAARAPARRGGPVRERQMRRMRVHGVFLVPGQWHCRLGNLAGSTVGCGKGIHHVSPPAQQPIQTRRAGPVPAVVATRADHGCVAALAITGCGRYWSRSRRPQRLTALQMDKPERWRRWAGPHTVGGRSVPARCRAAAASGREGDAGVAEPELSFAGLLRQLRAEVQLTQEELAEAASLQPAGGQRPGTGAFTAPPTRTPPSCWPGRSAWPGRRGAVRRGCPGAGADRGDAGRGAGKLCGHDPRPAA